MSEQLSEQEILQTPILVEVTPSRLTVRASRRCREQVKLLLLNLVALGVDVNVQESGLYCHWCPHQPIFATEAEWEDHNISHQRYCEYPGCTQVFIPEELGQDVYHCSKHEPRSWRI